MAWRLARSLQVLRAEVLALRPGTTVWTIGDEDHQDEWSDHNPNAAGVVCASDTLGDAGLDLHWYSRRVVASRHPALKYVIYSRQIWSATRAGEGWRPYRGSNPHTGHVHVSVGVGPDGRSTGPYDDTSPWGLLEEDNMPSVREVWYDDIIEAPPGYDTTKNPKWSPASVIRSAHLYARTAAEQAKAAVAGQQAILAAVAGDDVLAAVKAELAKHDKAMADRLSALIPALAGAVRDAVPDANQATVEAALRQVLGALDEQ